MCLNILLAYVSVHPFRCLESSEVRKQIGPPETKIMGGCEQSCGCWKNLTHVLYKTKNSCSQPQTFSLVPIYLCFICL